MYKYLSIMLTFLLIAVMATPMVSAQSATGQTWTSSITYYTPSTTGGTLLIDYYDSAGTKYSAPSITLQPHKAGSLFIGSVTTSPALPSTLAGSAVLSSDVPVVATYVQFASGTEANNYGRLLYSSFRPEDAASTFYIPTVLYQTAGSTSRIGVQNIESTQITATLKFYAIGATTPTATKNVNLPGQSSYIFKPSDIAGLTPPFNGSLVINAGGRVVAASEETDDAGRGAYAFEGTAQGANTIYMPTMLCKTGTEQQISYYAIQNAGSVAATVSITYYTKLGTVAGTMPSTNIGQGGKLSTNPCANSVAAGTSGSAVINSVGAPVIAIGKVKANNGMATAFVGQAQGSTKLAAPYVRWAGPTRSDFRAYIAVMNVGSAPATNIVAKYYDGNGNLIASPTLASAGTPLNPYIKVNTDPSSAGALNASSEFGFSPVGGAVEFNSDQPIVVVTSLQRDLSPALGTVTRFAEDYNAVPIP